MTPQTDFHCSLVPSVIPAATPLHVAIDAWDSAARREIAAVLVMFEDVLVVDDDSADVTIIAGDDARGSAPVLALVRDDAEASRALAAGAHGAVLRSSSPERIHAALHAVAVGLHVAESPARDAAITLTSREQEVLQLLAVGLTNKEIARRLGITENTVKFHVNGVLGKLDAESRTEAVVHAARLGIVSF